ncbi:MAG TPA: family 10 glycosylhydrolase, partial [Vicinamibacterales bacterium]
MRSGWVISRLRRGSVALGILCGVWIAQPLNVAQGWPSRLPGTAPDSGEIRALWVTRSSLTSPAGIATLVRIAHDQGFNTLLVQVRGRGDAYYTTDLEPRSADLARQPAAFDPLATVLGEAKPLGIRVHAWVSLNLVSSAAELPASPDHLVYRHPEWLMVPRTIAQELARLDPGNPGYVGKIARWTRGELETVEGLYASPLQPEAAAYTERVITGLARRYDLDGVHLDYARYPNQQFDYSRFAIAEFRADIRPRIGADARRELDAAAEDDLFAYPDRFPAEWKAFRRARLTALIARIREGVRAARPRALLTSAVFPDAQDAFDDRLQDWRGWLARRLVDAVAPMAYTQEPARFAEQIAAARDVAGGGAIWAGIGAYRLTPAQTIQNIQAARKLGAA